jgi:fructose-1,6-bisphosphatase-3
MNIETQSQDEKYIKDNIKFFQLLSEKYPNIQRVCTEIINLQAILNLPKGTEHFISDIHGEYEAFNHILNNCSGVIRQKVDMILGDTVSAEERADFATLIYYPSEKLAQRKVWDTDIENWYKVTLYRLVEICKLVASKYTRSKVRKALPPDFQYIIDELLHSSSHSHNKEEYYSQIISSIIDVGRADAFIIAICTLIKKLAVDRLHIVGDIYDRGLGADLVMDRLMEHHSVDIQWGNHDVLWMGAAAGNTACIAAVLFNSFRYANDTIIERGYGISLRDLAEFAQETYDVMKCYHPKEIRKERDINLFSRMLAAIGIIMFKLEGQIIKRHPEYNMDARLLLDKIDYVKNTLNIDGREIPLRDCSFPTVDRNDPYKLTPEESEVMEGLKYSFMNSPRLKAHIEFMYKKGSLYKMFNNNLLFHGCIPMNPDGSYASLVIDGKSYSGKALFDKADAKARSAYYRKANDAQKQSDLDFMWYLWEGKYSPIFGKDRMATLERQLTNDEEAKKEPKNPYYKLITNEEKCLQVLRDFGATNGPSHIINGHVPVRFKDGESPIKANGRMLLIDGGFCAAYQSQTGIAGYTLIFNSYNMQLSAHEPFESTEHAIRYNTDIHSSSTVFEKMEHRIMVGDTDTGKELKGQIRDLELLLLAYNTGIMKQTL